MRRSILAFVVIATLVSVPCFVAASGPEVRPDAPLGDGPMPPAADGASRFELRTLSNGAKVYLLRFKADTGQSWVSTAGERWQIVGDDRPPGRGAYDVRLVSTDFGYTAVRIERISGNTWVLKSGKWSVVEEPESKPGQEPPGR